jgi:uncharacterized membrane protein (UPF0127 family)
VIRQILFKKIPDTHAALAIIVFIISFCLGSYLSNYLINVYAKGTNLLDNTVDNLFRNKADLVVGDTNIKVFLAETKEERIKGLSGKEYIDSDSGMLFIFDQLDYHGIWMKDMNFPIDIIWLNENMEVVYIEEGVSPESYPNVYRPNKKTKYVLEVGDNFVENHQIKVGDLVSYFEK